MIDYDAVDARHDAALLVSRKLDTDPLEEDDLDKLLACLPDIPEMEAHALGLEKQLDEAKNLLERAWILISNGRGLASDARWAELASRWSDDWHRSVEP